MSHDAPVVQLVVEGTPPRLLASRARIATSFVHRMVGLLDRTHLEPGEGLVLVPCRSIHTAFMRFPIDVVFLDRSWRVLRVWKALPPWRVTPVVWRARAVIELPAGTVQHVPLSDGDQLIAEPLKEKRP